MPLNKAAWLFLDLSKVKLKLNQVSAHITTQLIFEFALDG